MNNSMLQSLIMDRERTAKRLHALTQVIEIYQGEITGGQQVSVKEGKHKLTLQQRRNISRGLRRRAARLKREQKQNGNLEQPQENRPEGFGFIEPQSA